MSIPPRARIIAECCSNHGGDPLWIRRLIEVASRAGADYIKFQAYDVARLPPQDSQYAWLKQAQLTTEAIKDIIGRIPVQAMFSVFDVQMVDRLRACGVTRFKVGHADRWRQLWDQAVNDESWFVSYAWGAGYENERLFTPLATIPLYPAPLEALAGMTPLEGYSDHTVGLDAAKIMIAQGVTVIEKHFSIDGCPRRQEWDMDEAGLAELVAWAKVCATACEGTALTERWGRR